MPPATVVLVKHSLPVLEAGVAPRDWRLGPEGERQSRRLARHLSAYTPLRLVTSPEPKAVMTGNLVAAVLGLDVTPVAGLEEFDRPALPPMPGPEYERVNAAIFEDLHARVLGGESGQDALRRFAKALDGELARTEVPNLVAITHGTVIALFVSAHNDVDAFGLWNELTCPSFVVLDVPSFLLREVVRETG